MSSAASGRTRPHDRYFGESRLRFPGLVLTQTVILGRREGCRTGPTPWVHQSGQRDGTVHLDAFIEGIMMLYEPP